MDRDEKPPAPPLRLTSNLGPLASLLPVDMRPLPKEPDEKKHSKSKGKKGKEEKEKPNIIYPTKINMIITLQQHWTRETCNQCNKLPQPDDNDDDNYDDDDDVDDVDDFDYDDDDAR